MTTSYDLLRDKCNELLPERLELRFGCEMFNEKTQTFLKCIASDNGQHSLLVTSGTKKDALLLVDYPNAGNIVLGPELTITDALRALECTRLHNKYLYCDMYGNICDADDNELCKFNLAAPLSDPSNATACEAVLALLDSKKV